MEKAILDLVARLETVANRLEKVEKQIATGGSASSSSAPTTNAPVDDGDVAAFVTEYDNLIAEHVTPFVEKSKKWGDLIQQQVSTARSHAYN